VSAVPPFAVLAVCMGNICRSPMVEQLLLVAARELVGAKADDLLYVHGGGTGSWHHGNRMDPGAARQVRRRGGDPSGFRARHLRAEHVEASDLVITATAEQSEYVDRLVPGARARTFVAGELGRLLDRVDAGALAPFTVDADAVYARGTALVAALHAARGRSPAGPADELDDPWGRGEESFAAVADEIEATVRPLARLLLS
jgi:protein-tyrosine phosphatase